MSKKICFSNKLRLKIFKGVNILANAVKKTLGPQGKNVIIEKRFSSPLITKDGVTVAKEIESKNKFVNLGIQLIKEVAIKTNDDAGDGTTTATVLSQSIINEGYKLISFGVSSKDIKNQILELKEIVLKELSKLSKKISKKTDLINVGRVSSNDDKKIGKMIANVLFKVGKKGTVTLEEGNLPSDQVELSEGLSFEKGYVSHYFLNDSSKSIVLEDPLILICSNKLNNIREILPILERVSKIGKQLLLITDDIDNDILTTLILNNARGVLKVVVVKSPGFGDRKIDMVEDISLVTGAKIIRKNSKHSFSNFKFKWFGGAKKVEITKESTVIIKGYGDKRKINNKINQLNVYIKDITNEYDMERIKERISKLSGGIAVIKVGGNTELEVKERKYRIEDALNATKAAMEKGIVPGGGIALLRVAEKIKKIFFKDKTNYGYSVLVKSLYSPFKRIIKNSGLNYSLVYRKVSKSKRIDFGFDLNKKKFCNLMANGIIDPLKVVKTALINAISISCLILNIECAIVSLNNNNIIGK